MPLVGRSRRRWKVVSPKVHVVVLPSGPSLVAVCPSPCVHTYELMDPLPDAPARSSCAGGLSVTSRTRTHLRRRRLLVPRPVCHRGSNEVGAGPSRRITTLAVAASAQESLPTCACATGRGIRCAAVPLLDVEPCAPPREGHSSCVTAYSTVLSLFAPTELAYRRARPMFLPSRPPKMRHVAPLNARFGEWWEAAFHSPEPGRPNLFRHSSRFCTPMLPTWRPSSPQEITNTSLVMNLPTPQRHWQPGAPQIPVDPHR